MESICNMNDLVVFSHLRWDFVFQRPQHLMTRFAKYRRVFYFEEPIFGETTFPTIHIKPTHHGVQVVVPHLPLSTQSSEIKDTLQELVDEMIFSENIHDYNLWYYTPMALPFTRHLNPTSIIFDCMDELSLFKGAPPALVSLETELIDKCDLMLTGGQSLYYAKKHRHHNIHALPSSIDFSHFAKARTISKDASEQAHIPHPRIGFYGVIDERFNVDLLEKMATLRPDFQFVILGPVVKIDHNILPKKENIHYLDKKDYDELPLYLAGWDCAMMPFALNESTKYISPTKTPEFLAAGKPVVSTSISDVINPYKYLSLVHIADEAQDFIDCIEKAMDDNTPQWLKRVDDFLRENSWDKTFSKISSLEMKLDDNIEISDPTSVSNITTFPRDLEGQFAISGA